LHRLYSTFPDGWHGLGLLLLRVALAATLIVQGFAYLSGQKDLAFGFWALCLVALLSGGSLLIGLLTPVGSTAALLVAIVATLSWLPAPSWIFFSGNLLNINAIVIALAGILLGPRRRKVIIPRLPASRFMLPRV
jgi:hypothetical protein